MSSVDEIRQMLAQATQQGHQSFVELSTLERHLEEAHELLAEVVANSANSVVLDALGAFTAAREVTNELRDSVITGVGTIADYQQQL